MDDGWADAVAANVLRSVPDQTSALVEILRTLRPGEELRYSEHVQSGNPLLAVAETSPPSPVFWDRQGQAHALPALAGPAEAWVNNDAGDIAGTGSTSSDPSAPNHTHALFWDAQHRLHDLGELPNTNDTKAFGISKNSWVVGYSALSDANGQPQTSHAWVWPHKGPSFRSPPRPTR